LRGFLIHHVCAIFVLPQISYEVSQEKEEDVMLVSDPPDHLRVVSRKKKNKNERIAEVS
jgi:hypothetical protein